MPYPHSCGSWSPFSHGPVEGPRGRPRRAPRRSRRDPPRLRASGAVRAAATARGLRPPVPGRSAGPHMWQVCRSPAGRPVEQARSVLRMRDPAPTAAVPRTAPARGCPARTTRVARTESETAPPRNPRQPAFGSVPVREAASVRERVRLRERGRTATTKGTAVPAVERSAPGARAGQQRSRRARGPPPVTGDGFVVSPWGLAAKSV